MVSAPVDRYQCGNQKRIGSGNKRFCGCIRYKSSSAETQGRSVGSGKTAAKVFKNGQERPWDTALNEPDLRILVLDWVQKNIFVPNQRPGSKCNSLLSWSSYTKEFTCSAFLEKSFQFFRENEPQSVIYQFHFILLQHWRENLTNLQTLGGEKHFPARAWQVCRAGTWSQRRRRFLMDLESERLFEAGAYSRLGAYQIFTIFSKWSMFIL